MTSKCSDPNYVLISPECQNTDTDAYNNFITQMNNYCSIGDHSISNNTCIDYINNNKFIQTTEFKHKLKQQASDLCLNNIDSKNNSNCVDKYNIKPKAVLDAEIKAENDKKMMIIGFILFICIMFAGIGFYFYKRKHNLIPIKSKSTIDLNNEIIKIKKN